MPMVVTLKHEITFARLSEIEPTEIIAHMSDPRVAEHMPLLTFEWGAAAVAKFVAQKEECWVCDGLGHWAILSNDRYVGWGAFRKKAMSGLRTGFTTGRLWSRVSHFEKTIEFAIADQRIPYVTLLCRHHAFCRHHERTWVRSKGLGRDTLVRLSTTGRSSSNFWVAFHGVLAVVVVLLKRLPGHVRG